MAQASTILNKFCQTFVVVVRKVHCTADARASPPKQFYRRSLPSTCTEFSSLEGKRLFTEALQEGAPETVVELCTTYSNTVEFRKHEYLLQACCTVSNTR